MRRSRTLAACCALAASLALAPAAMAQDDPPRVDPDSPAGTEYDLPVDRARRDAGGGSTGSGGEARLFGEGVKPGAQGGSGSSGTSGSGGESQGATVDELGVAEPDVQTSRAQVATAGNGGGSLLAVGAGAAAVLLIGGLAGLAWRRRSVRG